MAVTRVRAQSLSFQVPGRNYRKGFQVPGRIYRKLRMTVHAVNIWRAIVATAPPVLYTRRGKTTVTCVKVAGRGTGTRASLRAGRTESRLHTTRHDRTLRVGAARPPAPPAALPRAVPRAPRVNDYPTLGTAAVQERTTRWPGPPPLPAPRGAARAPGTQTYVRTAPRRVPDERRPCRGGTVRARHISAAHRRTRVHDTPHARRILCTAF